MVFFDSHCHFDFADFDQDRELIWRECNAQGITGLVIPGVAPGQWNTAAKIAQEHENIYCAVGLHPWWIKNAEQDLANLPQQLRDHVQSSKCVAIGECGLDAAIEMPLDVQQNIMDIHLQLAQECSVPLIIHCRKAHNELLQQLKHYRFEAGGVIHGFSGSYEMAMQYWAMGFRVGIGGTITYERANKTREAVKHLPLDAILLETDAPDMPIQGEQGKRNSPINILAVANTLADLRGEPLDQIAAHTTHNAKQLFKIND